MKTVQTPFQHKTIVINSICDLVIGLLLFLYATGAYFLFSEDIADLVGRKPWTHRLFTTLCLLTAYILHKIRKNYCLKRYGNNQPSPFLKFTGIYKWSSSKLLWVIFGAYGCILTYASWVRHEVFRTSFDMAIFTQAIWTATKGQVLYSSIKGGICLLADHFSPLLFFLVPPYAVWSDPKIILLIQSFCVSAAIFAIYKLAYYKFEDKYWAFAFAIAFALYLPARNAVRFDFHPELLVIPVMILAFYFIEKRKLLFAGLCLFLTLLSKENAALVTFGLGLYAFLFKPGRRLFGLAWMAFSFFYLMFIIYWFIPNVFQSEYIYIGGNYLSWQEKGIFPLLQHLLRKEAIVYAVKVFGPLAFTSIFWPPTLMLTFPTLLQNLATDIEAHTSIFFQYTAYLTPFVFISAIYGAYTIKRWISPAVIIIFSILMTGVSDIYIAHLFSTQQIAHHTEIKRFAGDLSPDFSVRTHEAFAPHFANRKELHIYENTHPKEGGSEKALNADYVILDQSLLSDNSAEQLKNLTDRGYERRPTAATEFYIFKKKRDQ